MAEYWMIVARVTLLALAVALCGTVVAGVNYALSGKRWDKYDTVGMLIVATLAILVTSGFFTTIT